LPFAIVITVTEYILLPSADTGQPAARLRRSLRLGCAIDLFFILSYTVPIFIQGDLSALRKKKKTAQNCHPQTQEKTAEKPTQE